MTKRVPHLIGVTGIPGTGKSHFARSARALGKVAVAIPDPKEASFYGSDATTFCDLDWRPHLGEYKANSMLALFAWLAARGKDDSDFVVVDPASEVSDLIFHEVLKVHSTNDPRDVPYGRAYMAHDQMAKQFVNELRRLCAAGKTVICTFHAKMQELEGSGDAKRGKDMAGKEEWQFEQQMLPILNTSYRQQIHSAFDLWLYTVPVGFGPGRKFYVTAQGDAVRPAKHSVTWKAGSNIARIPNDLTSLLAMIDDGSEASVKPAAQPQPEKPT